MITDKNFTVKSRKLTKTIVVGPTDYFYNTENDKTIKSSNTNVYLKIIILKINKNKQL